MQTYFHEQPLTYDGKQLRPHFAYENFNILGDSIVSFIGPCDVPKENLCDLEDKKSAKFIFSKNMLHFIVEHFHSDLNFTIALQRLLITNIIDEIRDEKPELNLVRRGNDIYDDVFKLNVSIAAPSVTSCLIHVGINICSADTPVPTRGLDDYGLSAPALAMGVMNRYRAELAGITKARAKVRCV